MYTVAQTIHSKRRQAAHQASAKRRRSTDAKDSSGVGALLYAQRTVGNQAVQRMIQNQGSTTVAITGSGQAKEGINHSLAKGADWRAIAQLVKQGWNPAEGKPIIIRDISQSRIDALDLPSMLLLADAVQQEINHVEQEGKVRDLGVTAEMWLPQARSFLDDMVRPSLKRRHHGIIASENFWTIIDEAMDLLEGDHAALLARVTPLIWKLVSSAWSTSLTAEEKVRGGYLTSGIVERVLDPDAKFFKTEAMAKLMMPGAWELSHQFVLKGQDRPRDAAQRVAARIRLIYKAFDDALTELYRQTGEVVQGPAKKLFHALAYHAERLPESIVSLMAVKTRTAAKADQNEEITPAIHEIGIMSGVATPSKSLVEVKWSDGQWYEAKVLSIREDGHHYVHFVGYSSAWDGWYAPERLRTRTQLKPGDRSRVNWDGTSYPVKILAIGTGDKSGLVQVQWLGFSGIHNESWVKTSRVLGFEAS